MSEKIVQTAGRTALGKFAPEFAHFNDDVLFGENWNNEDIDLKTRCIITVVAIMSSGITDSSLKYHMENAKQHGVTKDEIAAIITHTAFYVGWPKAWAGFNLAKEVWREEKNDLIASNSSAQNVESTKEIDARKKHEAEMIFPIGIPNDAYAEYFIGNSYLSPVSIGSMSVFNVTFEPRCRNNWHIHYADKGGGQLLICVAGKGYYQEWGKEIVEMNPGDSVEIPAGVKHWHGAQPDSWFSHLAVEIPGKNSRNEWLEPVVDELYDIISEK